jgi:hypothetical protein
MTVAELIDRLRAMPQDMRVLVAGTEEEGDLWDIKIRENWASMGQGCYHVEILNAGQIIHGRRELVVIIADE